MSLRLVLTLLRLYWSAVPAAGIAVLFAYVVWPAGALVALGGAAAVGFFAFLMIGFAFNPNP